MGARFSGPLQIDPGAHLASCTMGTGFFSRRKDRQWRDLDSSPLLVPRSWKSRSIPLLPLRSVRPVQSLSACTRVNVTFTCAGRSGDRIPVEARFSAPLQTGPEAHLGSCTMGTGSFPGVKSGWGVMVTPHLLLVA